MSEVRIVVHRGTQEIGGCCTEIRTDKARILIDIGAPLPEAAQDNLEIEGVTFGKRDCDAILITHYHGDHIGEYKHLLPDIPLYMGSATKEILMAYDAHRGEQSNTYIRDARVMVPEQSFTIEDITITPITSDHSAFMPFMFLIEAYGKRILHTGDFRLHGLYAVALMKTLTQLGEIDLLITEGTTLTRESGFSKTEKQVSGEMQACINRYKYTFLLTSSGNIDRIAGFASSIPRGKYFLVDEFQKILLEIVNNNNREKGYLFSKITTYGKNLIGKMESRGFGMVVRANNNFIPVIKYFAKKYPEDTVIIYSMWSGYRDLEPIKKILSICKNQRTFHVSGHVSLEDLEWLLETVNPQKVAVIHTDAEIGEINISKKDKIVPLKNKETLCL